MPQHDMDIANGSGSTVRADITNMGQALASTSKGNSAPSTIYSGQHWIDDNTPSASKWTEYVYDGTDSIKLFQLDTTNNIAVYPVGGGTQTIASASTTDLGSVDEAAITISGTTTITSFGSSAVTGVIKFLTFSGALTLTHNGTSLILPNNGSNITTVAGDTCVAQYLGSGNWRVMNYQRLSGQALQAAAAGGALLGSTSYATYSTISTGIPNDDTIPQNTEGGEIMTVSATPSSGSKTLIIEWTVYASIQTAGPIAAALFVDSTANALATAVEYGDTINTAIYTVSGRHIVSAGSTSARTYKIRAGGPTGTDIYINGTSSARRYGGVMACTLAVYEF